MTDILTVTEAADLLDCGPATVQELARTQRLPAVKYGRSWRFPRAALVDYLNRQALAHVTTPPKAPSKPPQPLAQSVPQPKRTPPVLPQLPIAPRFF